MSCYLRHMKDVLDKAGIEVTAENKKEIDRAFHKVAGVAYKDCPSTWKRLKQELAGDETRRKQLVQKLKKAMGSQVGEDRPRPSYHGRATSKAPH
jgi:hypothetical protein